MNPFPQYGQIGWRLLLGVAMLLGPWTLPAMQPNSAFSYQGYLADGGQPANGPFDFQATLYPDDTSSTPLSATLLQKQIAVTNGLFLLTLDFTAQAFTGQPLYLDLAVKSSADGKFTPITPRQLITPAPYAISAVSALGAQTADLATAALAANTVPAAGIGPGSANINITGRAATATYAAWTTNLLGILPDSQLSTNIARLNNLNAFTSNSVFTGPVTALNPANQFTGTFNGILNGNGAGATNISVNSLVATPLTYPVVAWGDNVQGETNVPSSLGSNIVALAAGGFHSLALEGNGLVTAWGYNKDGQINVPAGLNNVVGIAAGLNFSPALKGSGIVIGWGNNASGQITIPP
ncbi:MAG TPA: hypothetical protein VF607_17150, partial [Verrucomicrobiae bacterium]